MMLLKMVAPTERMFVAKVPKSQTRRSLWLQAGDNAMRTSGGWAASLPNGAETSFAYVKITCLGENSCY
ncbi:hypothetical protein [Mesorhizobium sp. M1403]|uniref:hypothetical protein n=1 Tax=Mesorhizobium sp. M1403 TaxID=2957097 RepID=UPI00333BBD4F